MKTRHARTIRKGLMAGYNAYLGSQSQNTASVLSDSLLGLFTREERASFLEGRAYNHALDVAPKVFTKATI